MNTFPLCVLLKLIEFYDFLMNGVIEWSRGNKVCIFLQHVRGEAKYDCKLRDFPLI